MDNKQDDTVPTMLFQPCGINDLHEQEAAEFLEPLPDLDLVLKEDVKKDDNEDDIKDEQETLAAIY